jgi:hypothetical protein
MKTSGLIYARSSNRLWLQLLILQLKFILGLDVVGILGDTIDRTNFDALRGVEMANALGT